MSARSGIGEPAARESYEAGRLRGEVLRYERVGSTNEILGRLASDGAPEGLVVVAEEQSAGRGRHGRSWHSPRGAGFYGSILLRPSLAAGSAPFLTLATGIAAAEAIAECGAPGAEIKWPNDVLVDGRKICGILTETGLLGNRVEWAVVGIGVNLTREAVPAELSGVATSLEEAGATASAGALLSALLPALGRWYDAALEPGGDRVLDRWNALAPMARGRAVTIDAGTERYEGTTAGLTPDGLLRVERGDGRIEALAAGEVTLGSSGQWSVASGQFLRHSDR